MTYFNKINGRRIRKTPKASQDYVIKKYHISHIIDFFIVDRKNGKKLFQQFVSSARPIAPDENNIIIAETDSDEDGCRLPPTEKLRKLQATYRCISNYS